MRDFFLVEISDDRLLFFSSLQQDDDMSARVLAAGLMLSRYPEEIGRYMMADHEKDEPNPHRHELLKKVESRMSSEGLSNLKYKVREICKQKLFTRIEIFYDQNELTKSFQ